MISTPIHDELQAILNMETGLVEADAQPFTDPSSNSAPASTHTGHHRAE